MKTEEKPSIIKINLPFFTVIKKKLLFLYIIISIQFKVLIKVTPPFNTPHQLGILSTFQQYGWLLALVARSTCRSWWMTCLGQNGTGISGLLWGQPWPWRWLSCPSRTGWRCTWRLPSPSCRWSRLSWCWRWWPGPHLWTHSCRGTRPRGCHLDQRYRLPALPVPSGCRCSLPKTWRVCVGGGGMKELWTGGGVWGSLVQWGPQGWLVVSGA